LGRDEKVSHKQLAANMRSDLRKFAKKIWDYHHLNQKLEKADCILVLGGRDLRVAEQGAKLFLQRWAPLLVVSGGAVGFTKRVWKTSEAEKFAEVAMRMGVPEEKILVEKESTNTGENILFSRRLLEDRRVACKKIIAVHKPYMERRTFATFGKQWPGVEVIVTSPPISIEDYATIPEITEDEFLHSMVADLQKIKDYPVLDFQVSQDIPADVWTARQELVKAGYGKDLSGL